MDKTKTFALSTMYNCGIFSKDTYREIGCFQECGQKLWRIPVIRSCEYEDAAISCLSIYAGNPDFIDLNMLIEEGELTQEEYDYMGLDDPDLLNQDEMRQNRDILLTMAYERSNFLKKPAYQAFIEENLWWLEDFALLMALKQHFESAEWYELTDDALTHERHTLDHYRQELCFEIEFQLYLQFQFFQQYGY